MSKCDSWYPSPGVVSCPYRYDGLQLREVDAHLEELLELIVWLTTCGQAELKVFDSVTYPQLEGFQFYHEASGGSLAQRCRGAAPSEGCTNFCPAFVKKQTLPSSVTHLGKWPMDLNLSFIEVSRCLGWDLECKVA